MENQLINLKLEGFKSISEENLDFRQVNVLIGPNGAGKSNLIGFFRMLSYMLSPPSGTLQRYIGEVGGASSILHDGPKRTRDITATLVVETSQGRNDYGFRLSYASGDTLIFTEERCRFSRHGTSPNPKWLDFNAGHREAGLLDRSENAAKKTRATIAGLLRGFVVYHFHDTSREARLKTRWEISDNLYLKYDAANLGPFLLRLRDSHPKYYRRIVNTIRQVAPFFDDFVLEPESDRILLRWREQGSDVVFSAHQASDGTLRAMALITALMQPPDRLPALMIIDEPELGLHPYAINIIAGLIRSVSHDRQVLIATQSPLLLDQFDPTEVVVAERHERKTTYRRLEQERLQQWLDEYTLSELWNRNILGGRPQASRP